MKNLINNKSVRRFVRQHRHGVLLSIWIIERICRILTVLGFICVVALPGGLEDETLTFGQFFLYEAIAMGFTALCYNLSFDSDDEVDYEED